MNTSSSSTTSPETPQAGHGAPEFECTVWWCTEANCHGEHHADVSGAYPVPATADLPNRSQYAGGFWFPGVRVSIGWNTIDHLPPCVWLAIGGENVDAQANLQLHEAKSLVEDLKAAIAELEGRRL